MPAQPPAEREQPTAAVPADAGDEPTTEAAETSDPAAAEQTAGTDQAPKDTKAAFAAALERKKQAGQARSAHLDGHGGVGGATASHKTSRTFRRKSG